MKKLPNYSPKYFAKYHFTFPPGVYENFSSSKSLPTLIMVRPFNVSYSNRYVVIFYYNCELEEFYFFLSMRAPFLSLSCLAILTRTSNTIFNRSGKSIHPCFIPDLGGGSIYFSPLNVMLAIGFFYRSL